MFNKKSFEKVEQANFNNRFKKTVDDYSIVNIPGTILSLFGENSDKKLPDDVLGDVKRFDKVVLFVIDAFGYHFFEKYYEKSSFLQKVVQKGTVSKLTTQFPSTTSANITTYHSGQPVSKSGVIEWFYYEPKIDAVYSPFLYKKAKDSKTDKLVEIDPSFILPKNFYQQLNVPSYIFQYELYNEGPYSKYMQKDSTSIDFLDLDDGLSKLKEVLKKDEKSYSYFYHSELDTISHQFGPHAKETETCLTEIFHSLDQFIQDIENSDIGNTLFLLSADHGHTTVIKENAIYINQAYPEILPYLKTNQEGEYIIPCGSFRDMFLHVKEEHVDDVLNFLQEKLKGKAEVYKVETLVNEGIFGKEEPSQDFLDKVGDLVILAYPDQAIWWYEEDLFFVKHLGMHGGLTKEELEIPFLAYFHENN